MVHYFRRHGGMHYDRGGPSSYRAHRFDQICRANGIEHRLTKPNHPLTNGQVERMNRTIKEATVNRYHYETHDQLRSHLADFVAAYNFGRRLKTLKGLSPNEYICKTWTNEPDRFTLDPIHQMPGLNTWIPKLFVFASPPHRSDVRGPPTFLALLLFHISFTAGIV